MKIYSFKKGLVKAIINTVIFLVPVLIQILPQEWMNITIGGFLYLIVNWLKIKYITK